jgi:phosphopantetheine adenylyltransferase
VNIPTVVTGYIWRYAKKHGASIFFRGIRSWSRDGAEERHLQVLNTWGPLLYGPLFWPVPTIYLQGKPEYNDISSTMIRELCHQRDSGLSPIASASNGTLLAKLEDLVPASVAEEVAKLYSRMEPSS